MHNLIFVVYDGINNPVFQGQVITPIFKHLNENENLYIHLICFEKKLILQKRLDELIVKHSRLKIIQFKRFCVLGKISLLHSAYYLKKYLNKLKNYEIISRGPLAGWVSLNALNSTSCKKFTVQARGLIAIEYEMHLLKKRWHHKLREKFFEKIENEIYNPKNLPNNYFIESVSQALSQYLIDKYAAKKECIKLAEFDMPTIIEKKQTQVWRSDVRNELKIQSNVKVFCYNGSAKPWQDIDLTVNFFKEQLTADKNIFLLVLTQDNEIFKNCLLEAKIDETKYKVITVKHNEIYKYLSACDIGLLFRKKHLSNWISRPIKALEYKAVGLPILHNNTVKWLIDQEIK